MTRRGDRSDPHHRDGSTPAPVAALVPRRSGDGSFSLWCPHTGEAFHSADGAVAEARRVFVQPAALERFPAGSRLRVVEVAVGTGTNTAALLEAAEDRGLALEWWGLELDSAPLQLALADAGFRRQWRPQTLERLQELVGGGRLLWGDARSRLPELLRDGDAGPFEADGAAAAWEPLAGRCDLVLLDAFSPQRCPGLWSLEFLGQLARLLSPGGRLLTYCSAAAVRQTLELSGLRLAAIATGPGMPGDRWSAGTVASPVSLPDVAPLRRLSLMEREHMASRAGEPYRDPSGRAGAAEILAARQQRQVCSGAEPAAVWQRRWGTARRHGSAADAR